MAARRVHLRIHGYVQGVSFRYYAQQRARSLGLAGWVRNCQDGTVELVVEGESDAIEQLTRWAQRGPSMADVERVDRREETPEGLSGFRITD
jgi:acylphosphatase